MNHQYKTVFNRKLGVLQVVSELKRACGKVGGSARSAPVVAAAVLGLSVLGGAPVLASECDLADGTRNSGTPADSGDTCTITGYTPQANDNQVGSAYANNGDTINFVADSTARIAQGRSGLENTTYGALNSGIAGLINLNLGSQSLSVSTSDPITQGNVTVAAYNSNNFAQTDWGDASIAALVPVADDQYIDARFGTAEGGTVNVDIGGSDAAPLATGHSLNMVIKQTYLAAAQGADSTVNWTSRNQTSWVVNTAAAEGEDTLLVASYAGPVTFKGVTYEVTDAASLAVYNNALIDALRDNSFPLAAGQSPQDAYNSAFNAAVTLQEQDVNWTITLPSGDDGLLPRGDYYAILADGAGATGRITGSGQLDGAGYAALAKNGGLFEIEAGGRLSVRANGLVPAVVINTGGQGVNKGVIGSGYWIGDNLNTVNAATNLFGDAAAVNVDGVGSRFINEGIINVAASNDAIVTDNGRGFVLNNGATGINTGVINVGVNADSTSSGTTSGVLININNQGGSFTNEAGGLIYIGRAAQYTVGAPEEVPDVANNVIQYGVRAGGGQAVNEGNIVIGTLTQNATGVGVPAFNGPQARITNAATGAITIHGAVDGGLQNIGMFATDTGATITNAGTIMLDGTNAVALKAMGLGDRNTLVTHSGTISMEGGLDTQGLRNYGIWAEGARATANLVAGGNGDGVVNLNGDGAIGVHARNGGTINIGAGAKGVVFGSGENQIGFFTYGTGSSITNNGSAPLDVSTDFSTLFRVEAGADFTGAIKPAIDENNQVVLDGRVIDVSGARATGVVMTGFTDVTTNGVTTRDVSALTANAALVNITGEGGVALKVEGGAQVLLSNLPPTDPALLDPANPALAGLEPVTATTAVNMRAAGAVAAIVDGQGYDLQGESTGDIQPGAFNMNSLEKQPDGSYRPLTPAGYAGAAAAINPVIGLPVAVQDPPLFGTGTILATAALVNTPVDSETQIAYPDLTAYIVRNQAELVSFGDINMLGVNNTGILVESAGHLVNLKDVTVRNGQGVIIDGAGPTVDGVVTPSRFYNDGVIYAQDGTAALLLRNGALLESDADAGGNTGGIGTLRAGGNADGVRIAAAVADPDGDGPLQGSDPVLGVRLGANTILLDENSAGAGVNNVGEISAVSFAGTVIEVNGGVGIRTATSFVDPEGAPKSNPTINVIGNGTGILFQSLNPVGRSPGPPSPNAYSDFSDAYQINVTGAGGTGIVADARGSVTNLPSVTVDNVAGGSALVLGTQVTVASNGGDLISNSAAAPTVRANAVNPFTFTNTGTISNTSAPGDGPSGGIALLMANDATVNIGDPTDTTDAGTVIGAIQLADGTNGVLLTDGSSVTEVVSNGGTDTVTIRGAVEHDTSNRFASLVGSATGTQTLVFDSADYTLADPAAIRNYDQVNLRNASTFTSQQVLAGDPDGGAAIDVESGSTLEIIPDPSGPYTLANELTGTGLVDVTTGAGNAFDFAATTGTAFEGTVALNASTFLLEGDNTAALTNATLQVNSGSVTTVGAGRQTIHGLSFNGGRVDFDAVVPANFDANNPITVDELTFLAGGGAVGVSIPADYEAPLPDTITAANVLQQDNVDNESIHTKLIGLNPGGSITGDVAGMTAWDGDTDLSDISEANIQQGGNTVAIGSYGFDLTDGAAGDGLYVTWGLTQLDLQADQTLSLTPDTGASGEDVTVSAKVIGVGNLEIAAGDGQRVALSNSTNTYTGNTVVSSGTLQLDMDNVLGQQDPSEHTAELIIAPGATVDVKGTTQYIGQFTGNTDSTMNLNGGTVSIDNGGVSSGTWTGAGTVNLLGGTMQAGAVNTFSADAAMNVGAGAVLDLMGRNQTVGNLSNAGSIRFNSAGVGSRQTFVPTVLTVNGDYISNGGTLYMNTVLGDSDSPSDRLDVQGNVVMADPSQRTLIDVTNAAPGLGAVTTGNGILLVSVGGTSAANAFALASSSPDYGNDADGDYLGANNPANGYVDAGAFRYRLFQGDGSDDSWYLRTQSTPPPLPPPLCSDGTEPPCVEPPPPPPPGPVDPEYNPDVGLITVLPGILAQSNLDILDNLHRRKGDDLNVMQNDDRLWARIFGSDSVTHRQENVASPEAKGNRYGFQAGVDLFQNRDGNGKRNDVGLYAAYVKAHFNITGITDTSLPASWVGILRPETTALGAYWTYQRSAGSGFYSDLIFQYNFYGGEGQRQDGTRVQIDGAGYLGSWEIGYGKQMSEHWSIQPQAQIVAQKSDIDDIAIANGRASYDDKLALSGRLGLRLVGDYTSDSGRQWKPYIRANYWHGFDGKRTTTFQTQGGSTPIQTQMGYDTAELGVGFTVAMTRNVNLYAEADHVFGIGKASRELSQGIAGNVGIRVMFGREPAPAPVVAPPPPPPPPAVAAPPPPPPPAPPPAPVRLTLSADALFDFDSAQLRPAGQEMLAGFVRDLRGLQYEVLIIEGHTDRIGSDTYNQALSDRRANSVRDYLTGNGIPANNVRATGYGETRPVTTPEQCPPSLARDALLACLQPDRRVEVEVSGLRQL